MEGKMSSTRERMAELNVEHKVLDVRAPTTSS
jgi:hypothetical protein